MKAQGTISTIASAAAAAGPVAAGPALSFSYYFYYVS
jgi:hypothetical protein